MHIIKEEKIYLEDSIPKNNSKNLFKEEEKKRHNSHNCEENNFIIKSFPSERLDNFREKNKNLINDNYIFTLGNTSFDKIFENKLSIKEILDKSNTIILKKNKLKIRIKIIEDNKSVSSEQSIDPLQRLSILRKELSLEAIKAFKKDDLEIDMDDEDRLTVNNNRIASQSFSPIITVSNLRTYLLMHIPKDCSFIHASKQTPIPQEIEDTILISKINDENNNIFIECKKKGNFFK